MAAGALWLRHDGFSKESGDLDGRKANRLIHEKSPYLLQHAHNPVDWYPWGKEAFEKARKEEKPIFLSVGYSTCHWCHVMERESFEDSTIAELINRWFVPIKVDREERPDVDRVYMQAAFAVSGQGGWPLTVFLTPELEPFYAGTYFPPADAYGRPGLPSVLKGVHDAWTNRREQVEQSATQLTSAIRQNLRVEPETTDVAVAQLRETAYRQLQSSYDAEFGGFGRAPKFPTPSNLLFYFREWRRLRDTAEPTMALETMRRMAQGGIYDHLGGGFHRYSVDPEWRVPHFEKMLYDQAQLAVAYVEAYQITGDTFFAEVARGVLDYVARDLTDERGGFYSAEDADSRDEHGESVEGAFYAWTIAEVESLLGADRAAAFVAHYHFTPEGNFEHGKNVLHAPGASAAGTAAFADERARLLEVRGRRARPHLDDKVLTAWNGLMISAYARGYQVLGEAQDLERARRSADFILDALYLEDSGSLLRRYRDGEAAVAGELTDYAFFIQGLLDLYEASFDVRYLRVAEQLQAKQIDLFWDEEHGGFFDAAKTESGELFVRTKEAHDGAEPSGNSVSVLNLARLAHTLDRPQWRAKAKATLDLFAAHVASAPRALNYLWVASEWLVGRPKQVVLAGTPGAADTEALLRALRTRFVPAKTVLLADSGAGQKWLAGKLEFLGSVHAIDGRATAYVCEDFVCQLPTTDSSTMIRLLEGEPAVAAQNEQ
jgi:uncharacterized protein YyaL (SSP411 family)